MKSNGGEREGSESRTHLLLRHLSERLAKLIGAARVLGDLDEQRGEGLVGDSSVVLDERGVNGVDLLVLDGVQRGEDEVRDVDRSPKGNQERE